MKKKLLDRRGAAIELAIMMMVFSIFITTIILTTALLQNEHKTKAQLGIEQDIFLEQLGEEFVEAIRNGNVEEWLSQYDSENIIKGEFKPHRWNDVVIPASCTQDGQKVSTCQDCGEQKIEILEKAPGKHNIVDLVEKKDPTCTTTGIEKGYCDICMQNDVINVIDAREHKWSAEPTKKVEATCTEDAYDSYVCVVCGEQEKRFIEGTANHNNKESHNNQCNIQYNSCTGLATYQCSVCDNSYALSYQLPKGHNYGDLEDDPNQEEDCKKIRTCKDCGNIEYVEDHLWGEYMSVLPKSCTEDGKLKRTCSVCDAKEFAVDPATGHSFDNNKCTVCHITGGYTLTIVTAGENSYLFDVKKIEAESIKDENEPDDEGYSQGEAGNGGEDVPPVTEEHCPAGGTIVLKITVAQRDGKYVITEWSKK